MIKRYSMFAIGALAILIIWFFFAFVPLEKERISKIKGIDEARAQLDDFDQTMKELPRYLEMSQNLEEFRASLNSSLYAKSDILKLFSKLRDEADSHSVSITEISPPISELLAMNRSQQPADAPQFLNLTVVMKGGFVKIGQYLQTLEAAPFFRGINHLVIAGSKTNSTDVSYSVGFKAILVSGGSKS